MANLVDEIRIALDVIDPKIHNKLRGGYKFGVYSIEKIMNSPIFQLFIGIDSYEHECKNCELY